MTEEELKIGDDAAHGEEAYALIGQGQREQQYTQDATNGDIQLEEQHAV